MNRQSVLALTIAAARPQPGVNFADATSAAKNAIIEYFGLKDASVRQLRYNTEAFALIEEALDEVVPKAVQDRTGDFAETKVFGRDESVAFKIRTSAASKRRLYKTIRKGARGGIYKAHRLDGKNLNMTTHVESAAYLITLEEILTGSRTVAEITAVLADAWIEKIYYEVFEALRTAAAAAPANNKYTGAFSKVELDSINRIINGYGTPVILGFKGELSQIDNALGAIGVVGSHINTVDLDEMRTRGYVGVYKGTALVELPNYLISNRTGGAQWLFDEGTMFILPADEKPVKVAFKGESYTAEVAQPHGGKEWHNHRMMGMAVLFAENIGSFTIS